MSTADEVLRVWQQTVAKPPKQEARNSWRGISPLRHGADNETSFTLKLEPDGEHGAWFDFPSGEGGSLYELARLLNVDIPKNAPAQASRRKYNGINDYATSHGASVDDFIAAGWEETTNHNRPALTYKTASGRRWRFLDGNDPSYINSDGYKICWYGLERATKMAAKDKLPLVLCNGEASTIAAQAAGIPACAITSGEKRLPDPMLDELKTAWQGDILLAYDCDDTGRRVAASIQEQLPDAKIIDLDLSNHGDLADFVRLWGKDAMPELERRARKIQSKSIMIHELIDDYVGAVNGTVLMKGTPIIVPIKSWHVFGGFAHVINPGRVVGFMAPSGSGKTALLEWFSDMLLQDGHGGIYYGPEWSDEEMFARRVQRYGGVSLTDLSLHQLFMRDIAKGVPDEQNRGKLMSRELSDKSKRIAQEVSSWPGKIEYFRPQHDLRSLLDDMTKSIAKRRATGELVTFVVFDYVQVLNVEDVSSHTNMYEFALGLIERFSIDNNLVCIVGSQVTKTASEQVKAGETLKANQAQFLREDKFKLLVSISLVYDADMYGNQVRTNRARVEIQKNNSGLTGEVKMLADFKHLKWIDKSW